MDNIPTEASLSRTPTPHHKELRRLRQILRATDTPESQSANISEIKEAKVTHISGDLTVSQSNLLDKDEPDIQNLQVVDALEVSDRANIAIYKSIKGKDSPSTIDAVPKQPPPYHIAAAYSKNAHLFSQVCPPSPHDQPKQFSQQQPSNIHHPTPKFANNKTDYYVAQKPSGQHKWPFGTHQVCQVIEVILKGYRTFEDFHILARGDVSTHTTTYSPIYN